MNGKVTELFGRLKKEKRKALLAFVTAGDPLAGDISDLAVALEKAGVDLLELGMPFSDPMADGPVIQRANERSLKAGTTLEKIFATVTAIRKKTQLPILLMGYLNPVMRYGMERFAADLAKSGANAVLLVDCLPEDSLELQRMLAPLHLEQIFLLAPTSSDARIHHVVQAASGFLYYVSLTGVTGSQTLSPDTLREPVGRIRKVTDLPVVAGFGIREPAQVRVVSKLVDGVVVGSALIEALETAATKKPAAMAAGEFMIQMRKALD